MVSDENERRKNSPSRSTGNICETYITDSTLFDKFMLLVKIKKALLYKNREINENELRD